MFQVFDGRTADEVWSRIAASIRLGDNLELRPSRAGPVRDLGNVCLSIAEPCQRWVISREPAMNPAFAIAEVVWILNGRNDAEFLNFFNRQLPRFAGSGEEYPGAYGYRLRTALGFDQLDRAFYALNERPESRQVVLQIWDGRCDMPLSDGTPSSTDVPCNVISLLKIRDNRLEWTQILRSNDVFLGLPHNLVQFTTLQEVMAGWLNLQCGPFHLVTDSLHIYERDLKHIRSTVPIVAQNSNDRISLTRSESDTVFALMAEYVETILDAQTTIQKVVERLNKLELPQAYQNMIYVLTAEGLRRRRAYQPSSRIMASCTNPALVQLWCRWLSRIERCNRKGSVDHLEDDQIRSNLQEEEPYAILE